MELDSNLIALQSVLKGLAQRTGDFTKINYKGGNENKISDISKGLQEYLSNTFPNANDVDHSKQMQNIIKFLFLNTEFKDRNLVNTEEFFHLINIIPIFSKCLVANVIVDLKLTKYYCKLMPTLPLLLNEELLHELMPCLKQCEPQQALNDTCGILSSIIGIIGTLNPEQYEEIIQKYEDIFIEMLKSIAGINPELIQNWKKAQVHMHIGYTLLQLLKLLKRCSLTSNSLSRITDEIIQLTITIMKAVTINVFCVWAEVKNEQEDQPMQAVVAGEAYYIIEHLQKYKPAQELVQMLASIARKPKSINEIIAEADVTAMISNINKCDDNQQRWFKAFMNTNVLQTKESEECLMKWSHLCKRDDVTRLLNISNTSKNPKAIIELIIKCAKSLDVEDLAFITAKYLRENNTVDFNTVTVKENLTLLLNKVQNTSETNQDFVKDIYLLLLQNPNVVLTTLYMECLKNSVHTQRLKDIFKEIKIAVSINGLSRTALFQTFRTNTPCPQNVQNYKELLDLLLELSYIKDDVFITEIIVPNLRLFYSKNHGTLLYILQVLNLLSKKLVIEENSVQLFEVLLTIMDNLRWQLLTFVDLHQQIVQECVNFMIKYSDQNKSIDNLSNFEINNAINKYYISNQNVPFLRFIYPTLDTKNNMEVIAKLLKLLPSCTSTEWILVAKELESEFGFEEILKLYQDILMLLCQVVTTQVESKTAKSKPLSGLIFCLQQYGIIIKEVLQPKYSSLENEMFLAKKICYLIKDIPKNIRKAEGLKLIALISNRSLLSLKNDREFVLSLVAIEDVTISQSLALRIIS